MTAPLDNTETIDSAAVLSTHTTRLTAAFRERLAQAYVDPARAHEAFRALAEAASLSDAAARMREDPRFFGEVREGGAQAAGEAGQLGMRAYHARLAEGDPRLAVGVLDQAYIESVALLNANPEQVNRVWDVLQRAYGSEHAVALVQRQPQVFLGVDGRPEDARSVAVLAAARDEMRVAAGYVDAPVTGRSAPLPASLADERTAAAPLPEHLQARLVTATERYRRMLAHAFEYPLLAEAQIHTIIDEQGTTGLAKVLENPGSVGALRRDAAGSVGPAGSQARIAVAYAQIAYEYHHAREPNALADIDARDRLDVVNRSARDSERAIEGMHAAIPLHGSDLEAHLADERRRQRGPDRGGPDGPDRGSGSNYAQGEFEEPVGSARQAGGAAHAAAATDPAVADAVEAVEVLDDASQLQAYIDRLERDSQKAEAMLTRLREQDLAFTLAQQDFDTLAGKIYSDPKEAREKWEKLVARERGLEAALNRLKSDPTVLGPLRRERHPRWGWIRVTTRWGSVGVTTTKPARETAELHGPGEEPRFAKRARAYTVTKRVTTDPVEWTSPDGDVVRGREEVTERANELVRERGDESDTAKARLRAMGGVSGSEEAVRQTYGQLPPAQQRAANSLISRRRGEGVAAMAASLVSRSAALVRRGRQVARAAQTLGEGPPGPAL